MEAVEVPHPKPYVPVTVYIVTTDGLTTIVLTPTLPVDHVKLVEPLAVKVAVPPEQVFTGVPLTVIVGFTGPTTNVTVVIAEHPLVVPVAV